MKTRQLFAILLPILIFAACGPSQTEIDATLTQAIEDHEATQTAAAPTATQTLIPSPTQEPSPTPLPSGSILLEDDFSNVDSGWDRVSQENGLTDYSNGVYRMFANDENFLIWANPDVYSTRHYSDVSITVDATKAGGPDDNEFGIICRYQEINNFYVAVISSDGYYAFLHIWFRDWGLLNMEAFEPTEFINQGSASNTIRLDCIGNRLTLYVNGNLVGETIVVDGIERGDVGLYVGTFSEPGVDIHFDNFEVRKP